MKAGLDRRVSRLIAHIYESAMSDAAFDAIFEELAALFPDTRASLTIHHRSNSDVAVMGWSNFDRPEEYYQHYYASNPWLPPQRVISPGAVTHTDLLAERTRLIRSEFYNDFLRLQNGVDIVAGIGAIIHRDPASHAAFGIHFDTDCDDDADRLAQIRRVVVGVVPHMQRAYELRRRIIFLNERTQDLERLLDAIEDAVFHVNAHGRILYANSEARQLLLEATGIRANAADILGCALQKDEEMLRATIAQVAAIGDHPGRSGLETVAIHRRAGRPLAAFVAPLRGVARGMGRAHETPSVVVFVANPQRQRVPPDRVLQAMFTLTPAEAKVAVSLANGVSPRDFAGDHGISFNTVRNQVRSILNKTGCRRQAELVALVGRCLTSFGVGARI